MGEADTFRVPVVVEQLAEQSLPTLEVPGLNTTIKNFIQRIA